MIKIFLITLILVISISKQFTISKKFVDPLYQSPKELLNINLQRGFIPKNDIQIPNFQTPQYKRQNKYYHEPLPENFSWANNNGINYLTTIQNQKNPRYCSSSWAFAASSSISDRIKIKRKAQWPDIMIGVQQLLSCDTENQGCQGGDDLQAYKYIYENEIPDITCSAYQAKSYLQGVTCTKFNMCGQCWMGAKCMNQDGYYTYTLEEFGRIKGEKNMMEEIYENGPISCAMENTLHLEFYKKGILYDPEPQSDHKLNHVVSIVGWGSDERTNTDYWIVRNSWGETWGEFGMFKLEKGVNAFGIESRCNYAIPKNTWQEIDHLLTAPQYSGYELDLEAKKKGEKLGLKPNQEIIHDGIKEKVLIKTQRPHEYIKKEDLPTNWDWRQVDGVNYMSQNTNQHLPVYCGCCWAYGTSSSIADRLNIITKNKFPRTVLSVQAIVNCRWGGTCSGGKSQQVYQEANEHGIPVNTCQNYVAKNPAIFECSEMQKCSQCWPGKYGSDICMPVSKVQKKYPQVYVDEYGDIEKNNETQMMSEIYARGPISCSMQSTDNFKYYKKGVYYEKLNSTSTNHVIQVLGWGTTEDGEDYWIGRNSAGTFWGEYGFFKISRKDGYNLNIETHCNWGVPTTSVYDGLEEDNYDED
ncbi:hypothetical protein PPERSA_03281 [Pseudocohnilembus persalinus]|uniref:Peptidase C1A papain C-terminal domain-containing protein n=1 Tax=Pseudocohnilembus persalinus TaxID=266149 RepID=A0A0V0QZX6_PSEPJ|nr:hypothetical protein PPERSA_03281 [Pseudocohnilembus persalinus]|eukprot:KRX07448.1 hypothetical protein PPERSA_03281 [Pseudocohnilembus persalinus]